MHFRHLINTIWLVVLFALSVDARMRDQQDRNISKSLVDLFANECGQRSTVENNQVVEMQMRFDFLKSAKDGEEAQALLCYQERLPQIVGIHRLYGELCDQASNTKSNMSEQEQLKLMLMTQRYRRGIAPYTDLLNDCLREKGLLKYASSVKSISANTKILEEEIASIKPVRPFQPSRVEFK